MPLFVPVLSTFSLKGSYPHLVALVPCQVTKAKSRSQAAPGNTVRGDSSSWRLPAPRVQREHRTFPLSPSKDELSALCSTGYPAALTTPPAPTRAAAAPSPYPGDGLMPGAGGILLPPAVTHTGAPHTVPWQPTTAGNENCLRKDKNGGHCTSLG